ncbi:MAG TPA: hypothetical protein VG273_09075 [Bryobacteraceae bacterium]|jgi:hypothetical protein|nr:hypothetical protein [Bryobacteraceae bacterium]
MTRQQFTLALIALSFARLAAAQSRPPAPEAHPNFEGIWNSATATPLERPAQFKDKPFFTPQEAADFERHSAARREDPKPEAAAAKSFASYNAFFYETGTKVLKTMLTSIITDPPDGKIPALTPAAAAAKSRRLEILHRPHVSTDLGLQDQCLVFPTSVAPMTPYIYNSNYRIVQTDHELMLSAEMNHDTRIIRLNQPHISSSVRQWLGDSVGHWEGGTLVVDTTNFNDADGFFGDAGGMLGTDRNLHVVERLSRPDADTILYRFEVDDPTAFTKPWKGELTWSRSNGPIYEYACHEGNYSLTDLLDGTRALERAESSGAKK